MRSGLLASATLATTLAACNAAHLGDQSTNPGTSPGTVTFRLDLPSTQSYCDQTATCGGAVYHVSIANAAGQFLQLDAGWCATQCADGCRPTLCPSIPCIISTGQTLTMVEQSWDGSYVESSTCGNSVACFNQRFVPPGHYVARMCATPGTLSQPDGGPEPAQCTATGPQQCIDVPFDLPGPPLVEATLPDGVGLTR